MLLCNVLAMAVASFIHCLSNLLGLTRTPLGSICVKRTLGMGLAGRLKNGRQVLGALCQTDCTTILTA